MSRRKEEATWGTLLRDCVPRQHRKDQQGVAKRSFLVKLTQVCPRGSAHLVLAVLSLDPKLLGRDCELRFEPLTSSFNTVWGWGRGMKLHKCYVVSCDVRGVQRALWCDDSGGDCGRTAGALARPTSQVTYRERSVLCAG